MANIRPLNDALRKIARDELNEVAERIPADIAALRSWLAKQPHLRARTDDQFLVAFLRGCKYSVEKAKQKIDYFYTIKTMMPEIFANKTMDHEFIELCRTGTYVRLPQPVGAGGPRVQLSHFSKLDFKKYTLNDLLRYQTMLLDWQMQCDDNCVVSGYIEVMDLSELSLSFVRQIDLGLLKKLGVFADKGLPMRIKAVHLVNCPKEAQPLLSLARSLMGEKLRQRVHFHKSLDELYAWVPREYMPLEYGGSNGCIRAIQADTENQFLAFNERFAEEARYGVEEHRRPGKRIDKNSLFGLEGSFRKLDID